MINLAYPEFLDLIENKEKICLVGGLGVVELYVSILDTLELKYGVLPKKYHLITSPEKHVKFRDLSLDQDKVNNVIHEFSYQEILRENYPEVYRNCREIIKSELDNYEIVCEITGGTKPVSIALTVLADEFDLLRIYFSGKKIISI